MIHGLLALERPLISAFHFSQRLVGSARAGTWTSLRKWAEFETETIVQNGVLYVRPADPSLSVVFVPAAVAVMAIGAAFGFYS